MRSKILIVVVVLAVIVGIGVGVGLLAGRGPGHSAPVAQSPAPAETQPVTAPTTPVVLAHNPPAEVKPVITNDFTPLIQASNFTAALNTNATDLETNWEDKIDDIVGSDDQDTNKVKQLFALFPKLPPDGQEEAAQHLSNLVDDDDYSQLGDLLKDDKLPEGVLDELLADVLNRPNNVKLPALLDVSCDPNHAKHDEAKDLLELYLGEDYGTDCDAWRQHVATWMQQNPD